MFAYALVFLARSSLTPCPWWLLQNFLMMMMLMLWVKAPKVRTFVGQRQCQKGQCPLRRGFLWGKFPQDKGVKATPEGWSSLRGGFLWGQKGSRKKETKR